MNFLTGTKQGKDVVISDEYVLAMSISSFPMNQPLRFCIVNDRKDT